MSAFKRINVSDSFVVPYTANKSWNILSSSFAEHQIDVNIGVKNTSSVFDPIGEYNTNGQYDRLIYDSVNTTYYPNFLPTHVNTSSRQGTIWNDGTLSTSSYYNGFINLGNLDTVKYYPTSSNSVIYAINVPRQITGDKILPTTFEVMFGPTNCNSYLLVAGKNNTYQYITCSTGEFITEMVDDFMPSVIRCVDNNYGIVITGGNTPSTSSLGSCQLYPPSKIYDDGNYNLLYSGNYMSSSIGTLLSQSCYVGNVFYEQNIAILTIVPNLLRLKGWRGIDPYCLTETDIGYKAYANLEQYYLDNGVSTGITKPNNYGDPDYVAPVWDTDFCPLPSPSPSVTPSTTPPPSVTPSVSPAPSITPSVSPAPSITPSVSPPASSPIPSISPSKTPSVTPSKTPSVTPSITPSITPSTTPPLPGNLLYNWSLSVGVTANSSTVNLTAPSLITGTDFPFTADLHVYNTTIVGVSQTLIINISAAISGGNITIIDSAGTTQCANITSTGTQNITFTGVNIDHVTQVNIICQDGACL